MSSPLPPTIAPPRTGMTWVPGGEFTMGSDRHYREEAPTRRVAVDGFWIDTHLVTNRQFAEFVSATGYVTLAEQAPIRRSIQARRRRISFPARWCSCPRRARLTCGTTPSGGHGCRGRIGNTQQGPAARSMVATSIPWCMSAGTMSPPMPHGPGRICRPRRSGSSRPAAGWMARSSPGATTIRSTRTPMANTWQGQFPWRSTKSPGSERTVPVGLFPANGYGLFDMAGNVWEWTSDWYVGQREADSGCACCVPRNPRGGSETESLDRQAGIPQKVVKGGSHLCARDACFRYRPAARQPQMIDTGMSHVGFRCIVRPASGGRVGLPAFARSCAGSCLDRPAADSPSRRDGSLPRPGEGSGMGSSQAQDDGCGGCGRRCVVGRFVTDRHALKEGSTRSGIRGQVRCGHGVVGRRVSGVPIRDGPTQPRPGSGGGRCH